MHYWRAHPDDWLARLHMIKLLGCNTLTVYVHWALHEPQRDAFEITAQTDFVRIIQLAVSLDLVVIARVGPYITAETDFGGFPYWLTLEPGMQLRRPNVAFYARIDKFFDFVIPKLVPLQYSKGGPIIDFQVCQRVQLFSSLTVNSL